MNEWTTIRRRVLVEKDSKRSVCLEFGIGWRTLEKILAHPAPLGYRRQAPRGKPKLGPFLPVIEEILEADKTAPAKQRHTAKRIFERLRDEYGYEGGITQVTETVAQARRHGKEVFVPLVHRPGHSRPSRGAKPTRKPCDAKCLVSAPGFTDIFSCHGH